MLTNHSVILYHTDACHLCDLAMALLQQAEVSYKAEDICDSEELAARYGTRIPVIKQITTDRELGWPFDLKALQEFLGA